MSLKYEPSSEPLHISVLKLRSVAQVQREKALEESAREAAVREQAARELKEKAQAQVPRS